MTDLQTEAPPAVEVPVDRSTGLPPAPEIPRTPSRLGPAWRNYLSWIAGPPGRRRMARWAILVERINKLEPGLKRLSDKELKERSHGLRWRARSGESLDRLLVEAYALVREAAARTIGMRHFDVQLQGGIALHKRSIAEMETGEGKTLVATLPAYLNALIGKGFHVVTVNDYLAQRDADWNAPVYNLLGLTVGCIQTEMGDDARRAAYRADITYGTAKELGFDYLRDRLKDHRRRTVGTTNGLFQVDLLGLEVPKADTDKPVQRGHYFALVDEADSILIDEARTPLIISASHDPRAAEKLAAFAGADVVAQELTVGQDFTYEVQERKVELTQAGMRRVRGLVPGIPSLSKITLEAIYDAVERAVRAHHGYIRDRDYVVVGEEIVIVDEFTGRMMPGRQWQDGLHQAIQAKEHVEVTLETEQAARITVQSFFRLYKRLAGMTGTAISEARELRRVYKLGVHQILPNKPVRRALLPDRIFNNEDAKLEAVAEDIAEKHALGRPVLIGTRSVNKSERLSRMLRERGIEHQVLNAKNHKLEAGIVAQAGQRGAVTVATNMAGRGTDVKLGAGVVELGGMYVIGTERHESRRIDRQLIGRAGRQGDPGSGRFYLCLDDDLLDIYKPKPDEGWSVRQLKARHVAIIRRWAETGRLPSRERLLRLFYKAQRLVERKHYRDRRLLMTYEKQRDKMRKEMGLDPVVGG